MNGITAKQSGLWYAPEQPGNGFNIRVIGNVVAMQLYAGSVPGLYPTPVWFEAEGIVGQSTFALNLVHAALGVPGLSKFEEVGIVSFTVDSDGTLNAIITISSGSGFSPPPPVFHTTMTLHALTLDGVQ